MAYRQYLVPGKGYINETVKAQFIVPGLFYVNSTGFASYVFAFIKAVIMSVG